MKLFLNINLSKEQLMWLLIVVGIAFVAIVVLITILMIFIKDGSKKRKSKKHKENVRVYHLDFRKKIVIFFDKQSLSSQKSMPLFRFFEQFETSSQDVVQEWLKNLLKDPENVKSYMEAHIKLTKNNQTEYVLLEVVNVNVDKDIVHLESHLLPHLTSTSKHSGRPFFLSYEEFQKRYKQNIELKKKKGMGGLIRIFMKHSTANYIAKYSLAKITIQAINLITPYLNEDRFAFMAGDNEILVYDTNMNTRSQFFSLANEFARKIEGYLVMNSCDDEYGVAVGGSKSGANETNIKDLVTRCRKMAKYAERNDDIAVALYEERGDKLNNADSKLYAELSSLIHNRSFRYYFTPVISSLDAKVISYHMKIVPYGISIEDFEEVKEAAQQLNLLSPIQNIILNDPLKAVKNNETLIADFDFDMLNSLVKNARYTAKKKIILALDQESLDLYDLATNDLGVILEKAKALGYELGLSFKKVPTSPLDEKLLRYFSVFILGSFFTENVRSDTRVQTNLRLMLATYSPYDRPIIVTGIMTIKGLEVVLASGVKFFSCPALVNASSVLETLDEKKAERLMEMCRRLV